MNRGTNTRIRLEARNEQDFTHGSKGYPVPKTYGVMKESKKLVGWGSEWVIGSSATVPSR